MLGFTLFNLKFSLPAANVDKNEGPKPDIDHMEVAKSFSC